MGRFLFALIFWIGGYMLLGIFGFLFGMFIAWILLSFWNVMLGESDDWITPLSWVIVIIVVYIAYRLFLL